MSLSGLESALGYHFDRVELCEQALTHKSFANEQGLRAEDNERLEFLGDAVLDLALSELLVRRFPLDTEGALSKKRASLVNEETLAGLAAELQVGAFIRLGKGETKTGGLQKPRILASTLEAIFGAIHLDRGFPDAVKMIECVFENRLQLLEQTKVDYQADFKTRLQERIQEVFRQTPSYCIERTEGPDHDRHFEVSVRVNDEVLAVGRGRSKKAAEQDAARLALETIAAVQKEEAVEIDKDTPQKDKPQKDKPEDLK